MTVRFHVGDEVCSAEPTALCTEYRETLPPSQTTRQRSLMRNSAAIVAGTESLGLREKEPLRCATRPELGCSVPGRTDSVAPGGDRRRPFAEHAGFLAIAGTGRRRDAWALSVRCSQSAGQLRAEVSTETTKVRGSDNLSTIFVPAARAANRGLRVGLPRQANPSRPCLTCVYWSCRRKACCGGGGLLRLSRNRCGAALIVTGFHRLLMNCLNNRWKAVQSLTCR